MIFDEAWRNNSCTVLSRWNGHFHPAAEDSGEFDVGIEPGLRHVEPQPNGYVSGLGIRLQGKLTLPPTAKAVIMAQYPIGNAEQWQKIAENLGALVAELEHTFVPEIEAVTGASPEWYQPES